MLVCDNMLRYGNSYLKIVQDWEYIPKFYEDIGDCFSIDFKFSEKKFTDLGGGHEGPPTLMACMVR